MVEVIKGKFNEGQDAEGKEPEAEGSKVEGVPRLEDSDGNSANERNNKDEPGLIRCKYDSRLFCKPKLKGKLEEKSHEEKYGCDLCIKLQTRALALTNQIDAMITKRRLEQIEAVLNTMIGKMMGVIK